MQGEDYLGLTDRAGDWRFLILVALSPHADTSNNACPQTQGAVVEINRTLAKVE